MKNQVKKTTDIAVDTDATIGMMAKSGELMEIGKRAIMHTHRLGLPATIIEDGNIIQLYPDGQKKIIGKAAMGSGRKYTSGKRKLG